MKEPPTDVTPTFLTTGVLSTLRQADFEAHNILRESGKLPILFITALTRFQDLGIMISSRKIYLSVLLFNSVGSSLILPYLYKIYSPLWSFAHMHRVAKNLSCLTWMLPAEVE